jgi:hypothetical protein
VNTNPHWWSDFTPGSKGDDVVSLAAYLAGIVQAGAGIVADSDPQFEQQECINKAKALFRAAEEAKRFASAVRRGQ